MIRIYLILLLGTYGCLDKVPFTENYGYFENAAADWFENEGVAYVFFELSEAPERLPESKFELSYQWQNSSGGTESVARVPIDFSAGVHLHKVKSCGGRKLCGSYSWRVKGPLLGVDLQMRYSQKSDMGIPAFVNVSNHELSTNLTAFSQIPYGIFDTENEHFQVRLESNFGWPLARDIDNYGMTRINRFSNAHLQVEEWPIVKKKIDSSGFVFPLESCLSNAAGSDENLKSTTSKTWLESEFSANDSALGLCYNVDFMDKNSDLLVSTTGFGLRNPVLANDGNLTVHTPLTRTVSIPVVIKVCDTDEFAAELMSKDFLAYQQFILGFPDRDEDVCFSVKNPGDFAKKLDDHLTQRLAVEKQRAVSTADFMFVIGFNERLSAEFYHFHSTLAETLMKLAAIEKDAVSPRLVGSLVYGSTSEYKPTQAQTRYILWCPQDVAKEIVDLSNPMANQNCTTTPTPVFKVLGINFVTPMGPFPTLDHYVDYVKKYSDRGTAKKPQLSLYSVPNSNNTLIEKLAQVTYFESEQLIVGPGESVKVCYDRDDDQILGSLRFRPQSLDNAAAGLSILQAEALWKSEHPEDTYRIGIVWEYPFWGGVSYDSAVSGNIVSIIPFQKSFKQYEALGEKKWSTEKWNLGELLLHCQKYCDHPYFDEGGVYQLRNSWKNSGSESCFRPLIPKWQFDGGA